MRALPYVLYTLAVVNAGVAMQLPHAALLHWLASSSFTLGLQASVLWACCGGCASTVPHGA